MDRKLLEFWGNYLIDAARSQELLDGILQLSRQGIALAETQMAIFRKLCGVEIENDKEGDASWQSGQPCFLDFKKSYGDFLRLMGVVPKDDYDDVVSKYETLKRELEEQKTKSPTQEALDYSQADVLKGIQDLIKVQNEQFRDLMEVFSPKPVKSRSKEKRKKVTNKQGELKK